MYENIITKSLGGFCVRYYFLDAFSAYTFEYVFLLKVAGEKLNQVGIVNLVTVALFVCLSKLELNPLTIAFTVWVAFHLKNLSLIGFGGYLIDFYLIFVSVIVFTMLSVTGKIRIRNNKLHKFCKQ
ncbi:hypothetical protein L0B52_03970 [Suttonella sp. R2A3]|uniref:hypothetical protein n=1 Tax=Suttonella sp. R2A3 TaxID=2908648 RepID=UPI001F22B1B8|nr:hypothetical protein [Suttonella sp. R2A3]UJF25315.1 hypothetical protein L0B52_03970 [Suttonella sp. R2A3]